MDFKELHETLLKQVQPNVKYSQNLKDIVKEFTTNLKKDIKPLKLFIGGSYAKESWLPKIKDVDLFILFPLKYKNQDISKILENKLTNYEKIHGSRDYFKITYKRLSFEIIPIMKIEKAEEA
jgi:tRNA nucleotidyltransferase (CCA-adding enzyme)